jgi:TIR domain
MSDIFISYSHKDRAWAKLFVHAIERHGWLTFWDRIIPPGKTWRQTIGRELKDARCVIVLWSKTSVESNYVQQEADDANERGILIPVLIEEVTPPFGFRHIQAADLADWKGEEQSEPFQRLTASITALVVSSHLKTNQERTPLEEIVTDNSEVPGSFGVPITLLSILVLAGISVLLPTRLFTSGWAPAIGIGSLAATITYGLFFFFDRRASELAKRALARWLCKAPPSGRGVQLAIIGAFDSLYSYPLLTYEALFRSILVSSCVFGLWQLYLYGHKYDFLDDHQRYYWFFGDVIACIFLAVNVMSDYLSLFLVRKCLVYVNNRRLILLVAPMFGWIIVCTIYIVAVILTGVIMELLHSDMTLYFLSAVGRRDTGFYYPLSEFISDVLTGRAELDYAFIPSALVVHLWMPLFAIGVFVIRFLGPTLRAVRWIQWFVRDGDEHPLEAIGTVAALLIFAVMVVVM